MAINFISSGLEEGVNLVEFNSLQFDRKRKHSALIRTSLILIDLIRTVENLSFFSLVAVSNSYSRRIIKIHRDPDFRAPF